MSQWNLDLPGKFGMFFAPPLMLMLAPASEKGAGRNSVCIASCSDSRPFIVESLSSLMLL